MPRLCGEAGSQGMCDVSRLALPESHQGTSHDAGIQGTALGESLSVQWIGLVWNCVTPHVIVCHNSLAETAAICKRFLHSDECREAWLDCVPSVC